MGERIHLVPTLGSHKLNPAIDLRFPVGAGGSVNHTSCMTLRSLALGNYWHHAGFFYCQQVDAKP